MEHLRTWLIDELFNRHEPAHGAPDSSAMPKHLELGAPAGGVVALQRRKVTATGSSFRFAASSRTHA